MASFYGQGSLAEKKMESHYQDSVKSPAVSGAHQIGQSVKVLCSQLVSVKKTEATVRRCSVKKVFLEISQNHLYQSLFFDKVAGLRPATLLTKRLRHIVFSCEFCEIFKNNFFMEHLWRLCLKNAFVSSISKWNEVSQ